MVNLFQTFLHHPLETLRFILFLDRYDARFLYQVYLLGWEKHGYDYLSDGRNYFVVFKEGVEGATVFIRCAHEWHVAITCGDFIATVPVNSDPSHSLMGAGRALTELSELALLEGRYSGSKAVSDEYLLRTGRIFYRSDVMNEKVAFLLQQLESKSF